ncbi:DUF4360 domain-containing protein [Streptomyces sp. H27-G5]|uniref:DUF4360 domain-containing protein n=1 Tax=Streptomyces sp. H27-G5 TaxID=2996698 RepID=UPI003B631EC4
MLVGEPDEGAADGDAEGSGGHRVSLGGGRGGRTGVSDPEATVRGRGTRGFPGAGAAWRGHCTNRVADISRFNDSAGRRAVQPGEAACPSGPPEGRKNCQLALTVHVPQGFTYAVSKVDYRGYGNLEQGATGTQKASYYFQGMSQTASRTHTFHGRLNNNWQVTDTTDIEALVFAPCGAQRNFNINTELRTTAGTDTSKTSYMAVDSTDGTINSVYHFSWKSCPDR